MAPVSDGSNPNSPVTLLAMSSHDSEVGRLVERKEKVGRVCGTEIERAQNVPSGDWKRNCIQNFELQKRLYIGMIKVRIFVDFATSFFQLLPVHPHFYLSVVEVGPWVAVCLDTQFTFTRIHKYCEKCLRALGLSIRDVPASHLNKAMPILSSPSFSNVLINNFRHAGSDERTPIEKEQLICRITDACLSRQKTNNLLTNLRTTRLRRARPSLD